VETWEGALEAYDQNLAGVILSNHGVRQLDVARSGIKEEKRGITFPNDRFQLFINGGVRRVTDVLKAVVSGATAGAYLKRMGVGREILDIILCSFLVGIGRPFLCAFSTYGIGGVDHAPHILQV